MSRIYASVDQLIGNTPLMELHHFEAEYHLEARLLAKLEYLNPAGSVKDRVALSMINAAEEKGLLKKGSVIIEPTSGNTGIGLCAVAAARGYQTIIVMPETMSMERRLLMKAYGAQLVLTDGARGWRGPLPKRRNWPGKSPGPLFPANLKISPIPQRILLPPAQKSGKIRKETWIFLWRVWAPAAPLPAWAAI